jgi:type II secretory pathway pseudopilin PulG
MKKAYVLMDVMIAVFIVGIITAAFTTINMYSFMQIDIMKRENTKQILEIVRSRLIEKAQDIDSDGYFELPKEDSSNSIPSNIIATTDAWGVSLFYSTYDFGDDNTINTNYANSKTQITPNNNILARVISAGENGKIETTSTDQDVINDDIMIEIAIGETNHFKLYNGSSIEEQTRNYNSVVVSTSEPTNPNNGLIWLDSNENKLKVFIQSTNSWKEFNSTN